MIPESESDPLFREHILDHYRDPRNYGNLLDPNCEGKKLNPLCGDVIQMQIKICDNNIEQIKFQGHGCAISQASASILTENVMGKSLEDAKKIDKELMLEMLGIDVVPARIACAVLGLKVLGAALDKYREEHNG